MSVVRRKARKYRREGEREKGEKKNREGEEIE